MSCRNLLERTLVELFRRRGHYLRRRLGPQRRRSSPALQLRPFSGDRPGAKLRYHLAVDEDLEHAVQYEVYEIGVVGGVALLDERFVDREHLRLRLSPGAHDLERELPLERRLDGSDDGGGILLAPRRVLLVCLAVPLVEVDRPALLDELPIAVEDPVSREGARADELVLR